MSTIDIGIAELPARATARTSALVRPALLEPVHVVTRTVATLASSSADFYVGSVKLDRLATTTAQTARTLQR
jgi:hypothetical protein